MTLHQLSAGIPIVCGIFLLYCALSSDPAARILKPTLLILSISGLIDGALVLLLDDASFRDHVGARITTYLSHYKYFIGGCGTGAVISSVFHGHWKSAWIEKKRWRENKMRKT